ncbi:hypothetical protein [Tepidibacter hydrothermalis]|uniref:Uncharacterized protein n=1 Tax=Tepidibacter hydrothermalis TaxID=3036126 RepID=A0ABY8EEF2_9FIRM|nr:hypothetical protein [Tepidibacter hydrothermalis]WFD11316.1 hypothetical protein P4S50_04360 [Tepidibacter hydrothermalis]
MKKISYIIIKINEPSKEAVQELHKNLYLVLLKPKIKDYNSNIQKSIKNKYV